jgi:hypothetical protein
MNNAKYEDKIPLKSLRIKNKEPITDIEWQAKKKKNKIEKRSCYKHSYRYK